MTTSKRQPGSLRSEVERLTAELGVPVTLAMVRRWKKSGYPLDDTAKLKHRLRNQERNPLPQEPAPPLPDIPDGDFDDAIERIKFALLGATNYEDARTYATQIKGLKDLQKLLVEQGVLVTRESQMTDAMQAAGVVRQMILKIPNAIPPLVAGMGSAEMVAPLTDYAHDMLRELSDASTYFEDDAGK
jgi:hypothetical protein